jgi:Ca2+-binding RTX toxin-like protein
LAAKGVLIRSTQSRRRGTGRKLAILGGAALIAFALAPSAAPAAVVGHFAVDPDTNILELELLSDEAGDTIVLGCSPNKNTTLNGTVFHFGAAPPIPCSGPEGIYLYDSGGTGNDPTEFGGGNDTFDLSGVSREAGFTSIIGSSEGGLRHDEVVAEGGPGRDTLIGGPFSEWFNASSAFEFGIGADIVHANGGDDELRGTDEADQLFGGTGRDRIEPGSGDDLARGGPDNDFFDEIAFDKDNDRFFGEGGRDDMYAGAGNDNLDGGPGPDFMDGMKGKDKIFGRAGKDYLRGGPGRDKLRGGPGKDTVQQ